MTIDEMIAVLQAAKEGKVIQRRANARFRAMCKAFAVREVGEPETKQHGRLVYTLTLTFGECFLDLSFMPASQYQ